MCSILVKIRKYILTITFFLIILPVFAENSSINQQKHFTFELKDISIKEVLSLIEKQSQYIFLYYETTIDVSKKVNLEVKDKSISELLDILFAGNSIRYEIKNRQIVLSKAPESSQQMMKEKKITGHVRDKNGEAIIGGNILVKDTSIGTITDIDGAYSLKVPENATLVISFIGYKTQEVVVGRQNIINIVLSDNQEVLDEVVVIGYGTQKKADLTGAVANISADKLSSQSNTNIGQALQGKIAGVDIVSQGGAPGAGTRIMIRGIGTLNNASPLYIVDGMYMDNIDHLNPNDIESIDVLKDASSAAIYGSRAANGVVIVTTKSGSNTEGKPIIDLSANIGVQAPSKYLDMLNASEWAKVTGVARTAANKTALDMALDLDSKEDNDWQRVMMKPALMQNYNVTIKGGTKYFSYYTGLGYMNQDGIIKGTNYKRYNATFKSEYKRDWFTLGNNVVLSLQQSDPLYSFARGGYMGVILESIPTLSRYDETNELGGYGKNYGDVTDIPNPLGILDRDITRRNQNHYSAYINLYAEVKLPLGLKYRFNATPDVGMIDNSAYENAYDFGLRKNSISNMSEDKRTSNNLLIENLLSFEQIFGKHKINAFVGYSYQKYHTKYIMAAGKGLPENIYEVGAATQDRVNDTWSQESALTSIMARLFYSYDNRYLITATYRRDGSSKFAKKNRYGHFPSVSLGWNIAEERFMKNISWLDQLKLRGGYGVLGNQEIDNYMYTSTITSNINYPDGNGGLYQGAFPKKFANPDIKWEETTMTNIGIDILLFNSRLSFNGDWYYKKTKDILLTVPIPASSGGSNDPVRNAGKIKNTGFEFSLAWNDHISKDFYYGVTLTGNAMRNEVLEMGDVDQVINGGTNYKNVSTTRTLAGYPIGGFWLIQTDGLFQSADEVNAHNKDGVLIQPNAKPGDIRFKDVNKDGKITDDDRVYCGSPFPNFTMGLNLNAGYKNFDIMIGMQGVFGNKIYNGTRLDLEGVDKGTNFLRSTLDYWTEENRNTSMPRLDWNDPNNNNRPESNRFLENGSFFRIRNVQLGYTFKDLFASKIQKLRLYVNMENLATITNYSGYTPDVDNSANSTSRGFDNFTYPANRIFMFGVNVSF